jgi:hypothetical protein
VPLNVLWIQHSFFTFAMYALAILSFLVSFFAFLLLPSAERLFSAVPPMPKEHSFGEWQRHFLHFPAVSLPHQYHVWSFYLASFLSPFVAGQVLGCLFDFPLFFLDLLFPDFLSAPLFLLHSPDTFLFRFLTVKLSFASNATIFSLAVGAYNFKTKFFGRVLFSVRNSR